VIIRNKPLAPVREGAYGWSFIDVGRRQAMDVNTTVGMIASCLPAFASA
jgi:hypothetical protein